MTELTLAFGAIHCGSLTHTHLFQRAGAGNAGFPAAAIGPQRLCKVSRLAVAVNKVSQRGSAHLDGGAERVPDMICKLVVAREANIPGWPLRVNAGAEKSLVGVNVAHANYNVAIHNERLYRYFAVLGLRVQVVTGKFRRQRFGPQIFEQRVVLRVLRP